MQVVRIEDRSHVAKTVTGDRGDLGLGAADSQPRHCGAAQVVERDADYAGRRLRDAPRGAEAAAGPGLLGRVTKISGLTFGVASSTAFNGAPTVTRTGTPVLDWRKRMWLPS